MKTDFPIAPLLLIFAGAAPEVLVQNGHIAHGVMGPVLSLKKLINRSERGTTTGAGSVVTRLCGSCVIVHGVVQKYKSHGGHGLSPRSAADADGRWIPVFGIIVPGVSKG